MIRILMIVLISLYLSGCDKGPDESKARGTDAGSPSGASEKQRWYTQEQVKTGAVLYKANCAGCHKENAEGTADWKQRDAAGNLPPPPLNGTAHAWHHPLRVLRMVVRNGGAPVGGSMPAFGDKLDGGEIDAILAWVQSHWSDEIYTIWKERDMQSN